MNTCGRPRFAPGLIAGLVITALGTVFVLDSFGVVDAGSLFDYWPLFLILPGLANLIWPRKAADRFWGAILVAVGTLLLLRNLDIFWISFRHVWPVILVLLGVFLMFRSRGGRPGGPIDPGASGGPGGPDDGDTLGHRAHDGAMAGLAATREGRGTGPPSARIDTISEFAMFGGGDRMIRSQAFRGGTVTAIMGGFDIDMRDAEMAGDAATIEVFVAMGGIDLKVPESWTVVIDVTPFMGGANYRKRGQESLPAGAPRKVLTITGFVFMGGIDVKH
jgi:predicted membrane protein